MHKRQRREKSSGIAREQCYILLLVSSVTCDKRKKTTININIILVLLLLEDSLCPQEFFFLELVS